MRCIAIEVDTDGDKRYKLIHSLAEYDAPVSKRVIVLGEFGKLIGQKEIGEIELVLEE